VARDKKSGAIKPITKTPKESTMAKTIKPMVCGSFKILRLIMEKTDARSNNTVDNSSKFIMI
jgi:hypothetical protein